MSWYPPDYEEPRIPFDWDEHQVTYLRYRDSVQKWEEKERAEREAEHPEPDVQVHPGEPDEHQ